MFWYLVPAGAKPEPNLKTMNTLQSLWKKFQKFYIGLFQIQSVIDFFFFIAAIAVSALMIWYTFTSMLELSAFAVGITKAIIGCLLLYLVDKTILKPINTFEKLREGNTAYAIYYMGYAFIIAIAVATA
jgi:hypothetical protein